MFAELKIDGHVAVITMCDNAKRNALSKRLLDAVNAMLDEAIDGGARAVVLASKSKVFCAGGDLGELATGKSEDPTAGNPLSGVHADREGFLGALQLPERLTKHPFPVVAAVDGAAFGGGFELTLCCDAVVAGPRAVFALPETGIGLTPNVALARLPPIIGKRATFELVLSQSRLGAEAAFKLGLVNRLVGDSEKVVATAVDLARSLVVNAAPTAAATVKHLLESREAVSFRDIAPDMVTLCSTEYREGVSAFFEKRPPDYSAGWERISREAPKGWGPDRRSLAKPT